MAEADCGCRPWACKPALLLCGLNPFPAPCQLYKACLGPEWCLSSLCPASPVSTNSIPEVVSGWGTLRPMVRLSFGWRSQACHILPRFCWPDFPLFSQNLLAARKLPSHPLEGKLTLNVLPIMKLNSPNNCFRLLRPSHFSSERTQKLSQPQSRSKKKKNELRVPWPHDYNKIGVLSRRADLGAYVFI